MFLIWITSSCNEDSLQKTLEHIDNLSENSPQQASTELKKVNLGSLSEGDRYYYDLLSVKTSYKNFERQTSDSIIRRVIDYYAGSNDKRKYAEALYYGGAVNGSIGDYPEAVKLYNESLELLPASTNYKKLRGNVLAGLSWIYNSLRLYDEAIEVISQSIDNDIAINDTTGLLYDLEFSGALHFHKGIYNTADSLFVKTIELAGGNNDIITARQMMYRAAIR